MGQKVDSDRRWMNFLLTLTGMVACSQPLAAEAGLEVLRKGGNAGELPPCNQPPVSRINSGSTADAAVAVAAALNVTEPTSCGLGGYDISHSCGICRGTYDLTSHPYQRWVLPIL